jgi:hypothetical protein
VARCGWWLTPLEHSHRQIHLADASVGQQQTKQFRVVLDDSADEVLAEPVGLQRPPVVLLGGGIQVMQPGRDGELAVFGLVAQAGHPGAGGQRLGTAGSAARGGGSDRVAQRVRMKGQLLGVGGLLPVTLFVIQQHILGTVAGVLGNRTRAALEQPSEGGHVNRQDRPEPRAGQVGWTEVSGNLRPCDCGIDSGKPVGEILCGLAECRRAATCRAVQRRKPDRLGGGERLGELAAQLGPPLARGARQQQQPDRRGS